MPIQLACPNCATTFTFADALRGSTVRCNTCRATFVVTSRAAGVPVVYPVDDGHRMHAKPRAVAAPPRSVAVESSAEPAEPPRSNRGPLIIVLVLGALAAVIVLVMGLAAAAWLMFDNRTTSAAPVAATVADRADWNPDFVAAETNVAVSIRDSSGNEIRPTLTVSVGDKALRI